MTHQASQVFYVKDPVSDNWSVVLHGKKQESIQQDDQLNLDISHNRSLTSTVIGQLDEDDVVDDVHAIRNDHDEGIYICMFNY